MLNIPNFPLLIYHACTLLINEVHAWENDIDLNGKFSCIKEFSLVHSEALSKASYFVSPSSRRESPWNHRKIKDDDELVYVERAFCLRRKSLRTYLLSPNYNFIKLTPRLNKLKLLFRLNPQGIYKWMLLKIEIFLLGQLFDKSMMFTL